MHILVILFLSIVSFPSFSQQTEEHARVCAPFRGGIVDPALIQTMLQASEEGRLYRIVPEKSKVGFCVNSIIGRIEARFQGVEGGLALRKEVWGDRSQMLIMVDANSVEMDADYLKNMLKSEYFLDTYTYSKILFISKKLWWLNPDKAILEGILTMHGVSKPVYFEVNISTAANTDPESVANIIITAKSFINRTDFDIDHLTLLVDDTVELCIYIEAALFKK